MVNECLRFKQKKHLISVGKISCFGLKFQMKSTQTQLEIFWRLIKNTLFCFLFIPDSGLQLSAVWQVSRSNTLHQPCPPQFTHSLNYASLRKLILCTIDNDPISGVNTFCRGENCCSPSTLSAIVKYQDASLFIITVGITGLHRWFVHLCDAK